MHSIRRSCQAAIFNPSSIPKVANGYTRAFSQSAACWRGTLPKYLEPSSPELINLLSTLNAKVLLPEHLTREQEKLVYKDTNRARLESEPLYITLGEVTLPLEHIRREKDQPDRWRTIKNVVEKSKTQDDWDNVVRMVEGFEGAGIRLRQGWREKILRKLNEAGMQHLVLKALQRSEKTRLNLKDESVTYLVLKGIHDKGVESGWDKSETERALSLAEQVTELMESKEHLGSTTPFPGDLRTSPFVIAGPLEMAAVLAKRYHGGQDHDGKVAKYAYIMMNAVTIKSEPNDGQVVLNATLSPAYDFLNDVLPREFDKLNLPASFPDRSVRIKAISEHNQTAHRLVRLWNAIKATQTVLGSSMPNAEVAKKVTEDIRNALLGAELRLGELSAGGSDAGLGQLRKHISACEAA